ncbi:hypothetical protein AVEN_217595-1 [Araneus ventricosus]|uniref:Uncharacterized protein n=1 Tax=Araneus ventricosus TaxID=182803 RepID=A0A4Y2FGA2_ARAVE|nr:hypothetical protein AVEN_217595-1 [Araneus ventricosus]
MKEDPVAFSSSKAFDHATIRRSKTELFGVPNGTVVFSDESRFSLTDDDRRVKILDEHRRITVSDVISTGRRPTVVL